VILLYIALQIAALLKAAPQLTCTIEMSVGILPGLTTVLSRVFMVVSSPIQYLD
jgi:hypothetical protein